MEHFVMAEKARLFGDREKHNEILKVESPRTAKSLGRKVSGFDEATWRKNRFEIVVTGAQAKFVQNEDMGNFLMGTGSKVLVEE